MARYKLHCFCQSGNSYKAALYLECAGLDWEPVFTDFLKGQTRDPKWRADVNEMGEAPVLEVDGRRLSQSGVILTWLAEKTGKFKPASEEARAVIAGVIRDSFNWFVDIVAERRALNRGQALTLADGRIFSGRQALDAKLVDEIGGEDEAVAWLGTQGVDTGLPIRDWRADDGRGVWSLADAARAWIAERLGVPPELLRHIGIDRILPENLKLDGLLSVWQGSFSGDQ